MSDEAKEPPEPEAPAEAPADAPAEAAPPDPPDPAPAEEAPSVSQPPPLEEPAPPAEAVPVAPDSSDPLGMGLFDAPKPGAISSGPFEISSFSDNLAAGGEDLPPSTVIANAMGRGNKGLPLRTIVGITVGVLVVSVGLALLLFR